MYLTRFRINPQRRQARKLLGSPQAMHAAVLSSYMDPPAPTPESRILWRVDFEGPKVTLYISGPDRPDPTALKEQAGWSELPGGWDTTEYQPFLDKLDKGQVWAFRLTANPVRFGHTEHHTDTVALGHVTVDQQLDWLLSRTERHGFAVIPGSAIVHAARTWQFKREKHTVTLKVATFDGALEIREPAPYRRMLTAGIGRARGYGCGLMTLARIHQ